jgi:NTP pyrophosphatase (non-canonical NTP hydrolase)
MSICMHNKIESSCPMCNDDYMAQIEQKNTALEKELSLLKLQMANDQNDPANFNQLTCAETERLAILSEECGEVVQIIGKIMRHGFESSHPDGGPTNRELLEKEIGDIEAAVQCLLKPLNGDKHDVRGENISKFARQKLKKISLYLHHNLTK